MTSRTEPGVPSDNTTVLEVLAEFAEVGYGGDAFYEPGARLRCGQCGDVSPAADWQLDALRKLEGASDPADTQVVLAVRCRVCGHRATTVMHLGTDADPDAIELFMALDRSLPAAPPSA